MTKTVRVVEALLTASIGAVLAGMFFTWLGPFPPPLGAVAGAVAGLNGAVSGATGIYNWWTARGWVALAADSTWGLAGVFCGLVLHGLNLVLSNSGWTAEMSRRRNRHVYAAGWAVRRSFVLAWGNVVSNAGGQVGLNGSSPQVVRRRRLIDVHEGLHIFQNRLFGPFYLLGYGLWMAGGAFAGLIVGLAVDRRAVWSVVETFAYYNNPFEYWAYRKDQYWPPRGAYLRFAWGGNRNREKTTG